MHPIKCKDYLFHKTLFDAMKKRISNYDVKVIVTETYENDREWTIG